MPDKDLNPLEQKVYDVSERDNPLNYNQMLGEMAERYKQTPQTLEELMDRISFHESKGDPTAIQRLQGGGHGKGRGLFQFETGEAQGGATAMNRLRNYLGKGAPDWTKYDSSMGVDASQLTPEQQKMLFLGNLRMGRGSLAGITPENLGESYWAPHHWAGADKDRPARLRSFDESMAAYDMGNDAERQAFGPRPSEDVREIKKFMGDL